MFSRIVHPFRRGQVSRWPIPARRRLVTMRDNQLWIDGQDQPVSWVWLRDACSCSSCVHPSTKQKLYRTTDIPPDITPSASRPITIGGNSVSVHWSEESTSFDSKSTRSQAPHTSVYSFDWLQQHASGRHVADRYSPLSRSIASSAITWNAETLQRSKSLWVPYSSLQSNEAIVQSTIEHLLRYGIVFISGVPTDRIDHETSEVRRLVSHFGSIRETFYGALWDVKNRRASTNVAFTNLNLDLHMDLLYFESPPRYQILHSIRNRVVGGMSVFVDAFEHAGRLHESYPEHFQVLAKTPVNFYYKNDGHFHHYAHPTIELHPCAKDVTSVQSINYSPPFQAPFPLDTHPGMWQALRTFTSMLDEPASRFEYTMQEGDAVIFDNRRVLHARTAFQSKDGTKGDDIDRWLQGCYLEVDSVHETSRMLALK